MIDGVLVRRDPSHRVDDCHSEPFAGVILSVAKNLGPAQGKFGEASEESPTRDAPTIGDSSAEFILSRAQGRL